MRKTELIVSGEVIHPKTKASIVGHEHTNIEAYLDQQNRTSSTITQSPAMSQVGVGDDMDLSFCVENGFYESATLYGKTLVNSIQEPSRQDVVLPYAFEEGRYVTINDTKESGALGVELKGQTLKSLYTKTFTLDPKTQYSQLSVAHDKIQIELNKEYTIMIDVYKNNSNCPLSFNTYGHNTTPTNGLRFNAGETGRKIAKVVFTSKQYSRWFWFETTIADTTATDSIQCEITVVDGNYVDVVHSHFEGLISCKMPTLHTVGKNLFDKTKLSGGEFATFNNKNVYKYLDNGTNFNYNGEFKKDTQYTLSIRIYRDDTNTNKATTINFYYSDGTISSKNASHNVPVVITSEMGKTVEKIKGTWNYSQNVYIDLDATQLEEGSVATSYEPYKSSILSLPEEIVLRSLPNGVCDTFNTRTGVYTQRIEEVVLNGSENWATYALNENFPDVAGFYYTHRGGKTATGVVNQNYIGSLPVFTQEKFPGCLTVNEEGVGLNDSRYVKISILKSKLSSIGSNGLKQWLQSNPMTIQYELETPIVTKINLPSTLKSWNTITHIYSEIPENTLHPTLSHSNPTYPVILKPSTKYSIVANSYSNRHTNSPINFNLGGATATTTVGNRVTTITTPSTLSNELLTMGGRGNKLNNVMVIEGNVTGDEPYFEGICDSKSPILSNVGKNICDLRNYTLQPSYGNANPTIISATQDTLTFKPSRTDDWSGVRYKLKPNKFYSVTVKVTCNINSSYRVFFNNEGEETRCAEVANGAEYTRIFNGSTEAVTISGIRNSEGTAEYTIDYLSIIESPNKTNVPYEPYKSNILSCNGDKIELTEAMFEQGSIYFSSGSTFASMTQNVDGARIRTKNLLSLNPNISYSVSISNDYYFTLSKYNGEQRGHSETGWTQNAIITPTSDMKDFGVVIKRANNKTITASEFNQSNFQIREADKTVVLRSLPSGICDTLNIETGEYVQRIGEVRITPDVMESTNYGDDGNKSYLYFAPGVMDRLFPNRDRVTTPHDRNIVCAELPTMPGYGSFSPVLSVTQNEVVVIFKFPSSFSSDSSNFQKKINYIKEYVRKVGQLTFQYKLATPIVKTVDLSSYPFAYKDGHVILSSGSIEPSLTPKIEYVVQTNRAGAIQANQDRLINHDKRLAMLEDLVLHQLIQLEYNRAKCTFLSQTRQIFEGGIQMYHTKYELLSEFIEKKLYRSLEEVFEMLDVYFMLGDISDGEYDALYEALMPSTEEIFEVEETFDHEDVEV